MQKFTKNCQNKEQILNGNFLTDGIGGGYDLILAISVALFVRGSMDDFPKKCYGKLNAGSVMLGISEAISAEHTSPWDMVMGYPPYYMQGMNMAFRKTRSVMLQSV